MNDTPDFMPALTQAGSNAGVLQLIKIGNNTVLKGETAARMPAQPVEGPGGADYRHNRVMWNLYGRGELGYFIFEPASPKPASAPVIVFNHGWSVISPSPYLDWIRHLVRKGNTVIYPLYQQLLSSRNLFTSNALRAVNSALVELQKEGHARPELDKFAFIGHSVGGALSLAMAAQARRMKWPEPKAIMALQPAGLITEDARLPGEKLAELRTIPESTLCLLVVGEEDTAVGYGGAIAAWNRLGHLPAEGKNLVKLVSDRHGTPAVVADHLLPGTDWRLGVGFRRNPGTIDYYGTWKLADALFNAAFYGRDREYALGNTPQQRSMGSWSDGRPVKELLATQNPAELGREPVRGQRQTVAR